MRRSLRRGATSYLVLAAVALVGAGLAAGALVGFSAETQNKTSTYAGGWLRAPSSLQAPTVRGNGAALNWTHATHDSTGQDLYGSNMGTTTSCTTATYATSFATGLSPTIDTTTDDRGASASGNWICYQIRSTHATWYTSANFSIIQVGLVPTHVTVTSGSNAGSISPLDTIALSFNQNITYNGATGAISGNITICAFTTGVVLIGDNGCAAATDAATVGKIAGLTIGANRTFETSTVAVSGSSVTFTLNTATNGSNNRTTATGTGTFAYTGSAALIQSSAGSATVCTAPNCTWAWLGAF